MKATSPYPRLVTRIRAIRGLTQEQLAHELGVTFATVNGWENERHLPSPLAVKGLLRLALEAGIEIDNKPANVVSSIRTPASPGDS